MNRPEERQVELLADRDLRFLAEAVAPHPARAEVLLELLREDPRRAEDYLDDPHLFEALFTREEPFVHISPYLAFTILLHQVARDLKATSFTMEWTGPSHRVPVFDSIAVGRVITDPQVRAYLAEALASYAHVGAETIWYREGGRLRRLRVHELDENSLVELGARLPDEERFLVYRRLGDLFLMRSGIFADHAGRRALLSGRTGIAEVATGRGLEVWESGGRYFYRLAAEHPTARVAGLSTVLQRLSEAFAEARRALNVMADRYLYRLQGKPEPA